MPATTTPDRILATTLRLHRDGATLPASVRRATRHQILTRGATASATTFWRRWALELLSDAANPSPVLDACFTEIFGRVRHGVWPETGSSEAATLVGDYLRHRVEPAVAVRSALRTLNTQRVVREISQGWCRWGQLLYRPAEVAHFIRPDLRPAPYSTPGEQLRSLARWVIDHVAYEDDYTQWGVVDLWQSPAVTLELAAGDCEDMSLVLWSAAPLLGLPAGHLVVGSLDGEGHAWVEFPTIGLYAEATSGRVGSLGYGPSRYRPWIHIHPDRCEPVASPWM